MSTASSLEVTGYFPLELLAIRKFRFVKIRTFTRNVLIFCLMTDKMQQEDYDLWPHGLAGGLGTFLPGFSRLLGLKKQADAA